MPPNPAAQRARLKPPPAVRQQLQRIHPDLALPFGLVAQYPGPDRPRGVVKMPSPSQGATSNSSSSAAASRFSSSSMSAPLCRVATAVVHATFPEHPSLGIGYTVGMAIATTP